MIVFVVVLELFPTLQTPFLLLQHSLECLKLLDPLSAGAGGFCQLSKDQQEGLGQMTTSKVIRSMPTPLAAQEKHLAGGIDLAHITTANASHMGQDCEDLPIVQLLSPVKGVPLGDAKGAVDQRRWARASYCTRVFGMLRGYARCQVL